MHFTMVKISPPEALALPTRAASRHLARHSHKHQSRAPGLNGPKRGSTFKIAR